MLVSLTVWVVVVAGILGWPLWADVPASADGPSASISVTADAGGPRLSVTSRTVPLGALLADVARLAGFRVTEMVPTERTVSVEFTGLSLDQALKQLLAGESFVLVYGETGPGGSTVRKVILLGSSPLEPASSGGAKAGPSDGGDVAPVSEEPPRMVPQDAQAFNPDGPLEHLLALTVHRDPRMRKAALEALTLHGEDERARRALMDGIRDPDPNIRAVALGLVSRFVTAWPGAEEVVLTALRDPVARVRQLAVRWISQAPTPRLSAALYLALGDEHPGVRALTAALLRGAPAEGPGE